MMKVLWMFPDGMTKESKVESGDDFLKVAKTIETVYEQGDEYRVDSFELIIDVEPYIQVVLNETDSDS